jgi:hypothetical protein
MTLTCGACNNGLATNVEADLADWHNHTTSHPTFSGDAVSGGRRSSRILYRTTPDGEFVLLIDGRMDPAVIDLLRSGRVDLAGLLPDNNRVHIALLKHAFLAACLRHGRLEGDAADAVRRDLIAARDAPHPTAVPRSDLAMGLTVLRSDAGPLVDWPVVHAVAELDDDVVEGVILGGSTFVSWSSDPARGRSLVQHGWQHSLSVGEPLDGTVVSVEG